MSCRAVLSVENLQTVLPKSYVKQGMDDLRRESLFLQDANLRMLTQMHILPAYHTYEINLAEYEQRLTALKLREEPRLAEITSCEHAIKDAAGLMDEALPVDSCDEDPEYKALMAEWKEQNDADWGPRANAFEPSADASEEDPEKAEEELEKMEEELEKAGERRRFSRAIYDQLERRAEAIFARLSPAYAAALNRKKAAVAALDDVLDAAVDGITIRQAQEAALAACLALSQSWKKVLYMGGGQTLTAEGFMRRDDDDKRGEKSKPSAEPPRLHHCSIADCTGFFSSRDHGKCMVCRRAHCTRCHVSLAGAAHECSPEDLASVRVIITSTKECPRCHANITRQSGCAQMMCTSCFCVFDYNTGLEDTGSIHNPHFFQLSKEVRQRVQQSRQGGAERGPAVGCPDVDVACLPFRELLAHLEAAPLLDESESARVLGMYQLVGHHRAEASKCRWNLNNTDSHHERTSRQFRIAYLMGVRAYEPQADPNSRPHRFYVPASRKSADKWTLPPKQPYTEKMYKTELMRRNTARMSLEKKTELLTTFSDAGEALLRLFLLVTKAEQADVLRQIKELADEANAQFANLLPKERKRKEPAAAAQVQSRRLNLMSSRCSTARRCLSGLSGQRWAGSSGGLEWRAIEERVVTRRPSE